MLEEILSIIFGVVIFLVFILKLRKTNFHGEIHI